MVQTDDNDKTSSAAGGDVTHGPTPNINKAKAENNESFYLLDDGSDSQYVDGTEPTSVEATADREIEEEQRQQEDESENDTETDVKAAVIEAPLPVEPSSSLNDPDSLLTSIRLVIGVSSHFIYFAINPHCATWTHTQPFCGHLPVVLGLAPGVSGLFVCRPTVHAILEFTLMVFHCSCTVLSNDNIFTTTDT